MTETFFTFTFPYIGEITLSASSAISLIGILTSLLASLIAIGVSLASLKQNSKMIEESSRPYVVIYGNTTNFQSPKFYLILKNFGQTGAVITSVSCDTDLAKYCYTPQYVPFTNISGTMIAPGQSFAYCLDIKKLYEDPLPMTFEIKYTANKKLYSEKFSINPKSLSDSISTRASTSNHELKIISYTLQDLVEKIL